MSYTITAIKNGYRLDLITSVDSDGRPRDHRAFEYPEDHPDLTRTVNGVPTPLEGKALTDAIRRLARDQFAAERTAEEPPALQPEVLASGNRL